MKKKGKLKRLETSTFIVKSNSLVEARYRLSLQELQIVLWLLTQIKSNDEDFKTHKLEIVQFAAMTGVNVDNRYTELRKITKRLMQRVIEIHEDIEKRLVQVAWLSSAVYETKKGYVSLKFDPELRPHLLQLKSQFTKIDISDTLKLKSVYAIRIFELLLQYINIGNRVMSIEELRSYCGITPKEYKNYFDCKRYILEKSKSEINKKTDYEVDYSEIKESRKIVAIEWTIKKKNLQKEEYSQKLITIQKELRSESVLIESLIEYGFSKGIAKRLLKTNEEEVIKTAIKAVNLQVERGNVKNPKAMLQTAIKEKWHPEVFKQRKKAA